MPHHGEIAAKNVGVAHTPGQFSVLPYKEAITPRYQIAGVMQRGNPLLLKRVTHWRAKLPVRFSIKNISVSIFV